MSLSICLLVCLWVSEGRLLATYGTQNTSRTATMRTATYRHGNTSFSIVGPLHFVDGSDPSALGTEIAGKIIVADGDAYGNSFAWARACQSHECVGVVMVTTVMGAVASLEAWLETDRTGYSSTERSPIPVATLDGTDALVSMDDVRGRPGPVIAMLDSCDIVDGTSASLLFAAPGATAAFVIAWLVNIVNMVAAIYKLLAFAIDREGHLRAVPSLPCVVFVTSLTSSAIRMLWFTNASFYDLQAFSKPLYRVLSSASIPIGFAGTAAIGVAMHDHLMHGMFVSVQHKVAVYSLVSLVCLIFTFDLIGTVAAAVTWHEYFNITYLSGFYFLMNIPVSILFIKYGVAVSNALLKNDKISAVERDRSRQFARRVAVSGAFGIGNLLSQVLFALLYTSSVSHYLMLYTLSVTIAAMQCYTFTTAFRSRSSIFDSVAQAYLPPVLRFMVGHKTASDDQTARLADSRIMPTTRTVTVKHKVAVDAT
ncbi:Uncharacterized protein PBTT_06106 [Plasmodiophora brassicae]